MQIMIVTIKPKNGKPIKKKFSDPKQAIEWINSTTAELAAQQSVQRTCANCGADDWRDAIVPDTLEICNRCGASR
jgi:hypothetical protein